MTTEKTPSSGVDLLEKFGIIELDEQQQQAVALGVDKTNRIVAITGPAGTGKTTIMRHIFQLLTENGYSCSASTPTGKAAKRVFEATGIRAVTNHMLLEFTHPGDPDPETGLPTRESKPRRTIANPLDVDVLLVDEYMMVKEEMHRDLISAMKRGARLIVFGDVHQLPPIEDGIKTNTPYEAPFEKLVNSKTFVSIHLNKNHRQLEGSGIAENALRILKKQIPLKKPDFDVIITHNLLGALEKCTITHKERGYDYSTTDCQVIAPQGKRSAFGTHAVNPHMQQMYELEIDADSVYLPRNKWEEKREVIVRAGSKVIQTKNDYTLGVFNGETGTVTVLDAETGTITVDFGDRFVEFPPQVEYSTPDRLIDGSYKQGWYDPRKTLDLAYAITTHKAQGSEYKSVIYLMHKSMSWMQTQANLYTAVTRAREYCTIITDQVALAQAVRRIDNGR